MKLLLVIYNCFAERIIDEVLVTLGNYLGKMVKDIRFICCTVSKINLQLHSFCKYFLPLRSFAK